MIPGVDTSAADQEDTELRSEVELVASIMESMPSGADAALYFREDSVRLERVSSRALERAFEKGTADGRVQGEEQGRQAALDEAELMRKGRTSWLVIFVGVVLSAIVWLPILDAFLR
jgi:hypothetical protein